MKKLFISALLMVAAAGCKSNPYCLNCKDSGNGVITPDDMIPTLVDGGDDMLGPDMRGSGGPCGPTNGGIEICDGLDNDCNGKIDDVTPDKLTNDKNCGKCGNECLFPHAAGKCVVTNGVPMCTEGTCQPGYIDLDGDPTNGCEYVCTPTTPPTEVCDGKDNNCDGTVDEGFTTTWFDAAKRMPKYDKLLSDCGQCGAVCNLGPGTVMACQGTGTNGRGQCAVAQCFNGLDSMGVHQTYRHNPLAGSITTTGCEYHCPQAAATTGNDCNPNGACTFPVEICNGIDEDCDFMADDNLTDPGLNQDCADGTPGKLCTSGGANPTCGKGPCVAGKLKCIGNGLSCQGSAGPSPESCDAVDNDCNGQVDDPFTTTYLDPGTKQMPAYDKDANNCGGCGAAHKCALPHGAQFCRIAGGDTKGSCAVICDPGFQWVPKRDSNPANPMCDLVTAGQQNSTTATTGIGCFYSCTQNSSFEKCDGQDNECNGCIDDALTAPPICSTLGVCGTTTNTVTCSHSAAGFKCTYGAGVDVDAMGNLLPTEIECDNLDNNCNGPCDENFPDVPVNGAGCTNPRSQKACSGGQGACLLTGNYACNAAKTGEACFNGGVLVTATGDPTKASDEKCNGKDDDCNGLIDEPTDFVLGGTTYKGWHDPVAQVAVGVDPFTAQAAHTVFVYAYEASRPDASATSPGSQSTRACANYGVLPWSNVTLRQAQNACAGIKNAAGTSIGRVCSAWEWQQACNGNVASPPSHWSMSSSTTTYQAQVCNDAAETDQRCNPTAKSCTKSCNAQNQCTCTADADCGGAVGSCDLAKKICTGSVCPLQCAKTCNGSGQCTCVTSADCSPGFTCSAGLICVGSGAWPTGSIGSAVGGNQCYVDYAAAGRTHDLSGNLQEWTATGVVLKSGAAASIANGPQAGQWTVNGLTGIFATDVGAQLILSGAANGGNNGTFDIIAVNSATSVVISNPLGAVQAAATITWKFIYNKVRGGNYATTASGGDTCEFDFDIQKASFANTDVGFRCCSDVAP
jgi:hypothetical protein